MLRELVHTPAVENSAGEVIVTQPSRRATYQPSEADRAVASAAEVAAALLARERRHRVNGRPATTTATQRTVEQLRSATRAAMPVRVHVPRCRADITIVGRPPGRRSSTSVPTRALPEQAASVQGGSSRHLLVGEDTVVELMDPGDGDSVAARPAAGRPVGHRRDLHRARRRGRGGWLTLLEDCVAEQTAHELRLDLAQTWGCEYRFTDRVLTGDPPPDAGQAEPPPRPRRDPRAQRLHPTAIIVGARRATSSSVMPYTARALTPRIFALVSTVSGGSRTPPASAPGS